VFDCQTVARIMFRHIPSSWKAPTGAYFLNALRSIFSIYQLLSRFMMQRSVLANKLWIADSELRLVVTIGH